jgi:(R,R)-butanediol dehydrogenase/meso-butanediol dehydrogenase/diacetyl reductase
LKAALLKELGKIVLDEVAVPKISNDEVLLEVKYCGICGSDVHSYSYGRPIPVGSYLGHEFSGVLADVGKNVKGWKPGDRVVVNPMTICGECYACKHGHQSHCEHGWDSIIGAATNQLGAFAKFINVPLPQWRLYRLPDEVSFEEGALVEPLSCGLHSVIISDFVVGEDVMVLGAGPIGLSAIYALKYAGAGVIIATEVNEKRATMARKFGADYVFNPCEVPSLKEKVFELTNGKGVDIVFDCSGIPEAFLTATGFLRRGGQIVLVGVIDKEVPILPINWVIMEWHLRGSHVYDSDQFRVILELLRKGVIPAKEMITSKIKLSNIAKEGFYAMRSQGDQIKILVEPDE